jgi:hypothetical protein
MSKAPASDNLRERFLNVILKPKAEESRQWYLTSNRFRDSSLPLVAQTCPEPVEGVTWWGRFCYQFRFKKHALNSDSTVNPPFAIIRRVRFDKHGYRGTPKPVCKIFKSGSCW